MAMQRQNSAKWILVASLAFVFGYFGLDKFMNPDIWIGWMPMWLEELMGFTREQWLMITGATEMFFAILLLIPHRRVQQAGSILVALHLLAILTQTGWNDIAIRDIGLLLSSVALFLML